MRAVAARSWSDWRRVEIGQIGRLGPRSMLVRHGHPCAPIPFGNARGECDQHPAEANHEQSGPRSQRQHRALTASPCKLPHADQQPDGDAGDSQPQRRRHAPQYNVRTEPSTATEHDAKRNAQGAGRQQQAPVQADHAAQWDQPGEIVHPRQGRSDADPEATQHDQECRRGGSSQHATLSGP